jgi:hypothetical protein
MERIICKMKDIKVGDFICCGKDFECELKVLSCSYEDNGQLIIGTTEQTSFINDPNALFHVKTHKE